MYLTTRDDETYYPVLATSDVRVTVFGLGSGMETRTQSLKTRQEKLRWETTFDMSLLVKLLGEGACFGIRKKKPSLKVAGGKAYLATNEAISYIAGYDERKTTTALKRTQHTGVDMAYVPLDQTLRMTIRYEKLVFNKKNGYPSKRLKVLVNRGNPDHADEEHPDDDDAAAIAASTTDAQEGSIILEVGQQFEIAGVVVDIIELLPGGNILVTPANGDVDSEQVVSQVEARARLLDYI